MEGVHSYIIWIFFLIDLYCLQERRLPLIESITDLCVCTRTCLCVSVCVRERANVENWAHSREFNISTNLNIKMANLKLAVMLGIIST